MLVQAWFYGVVFRGIHVAVMTAALAFVLTLLRVVWFTRQPPPSPDRTAFLEVADLIGPKAIRPEHRDPELIDTEIVGSLITRAIDDGCTRIIIGLGGTLTVDGGIGAGKLTHAFLNKNGDQPPGYGATLPHIVKIAHHDPQPRRNAELIALCDVQNPLLGPRGAASIPPRKDLEKDALVEVMQGKRLVYWHSYRADEILMALRVAKEFGFKPHFTHILEGYKLADELAAAGATASTFADMWGYKMEAWDAIPHNASLMAERGVIVTMNSDSDERARRLYQEAAKAMRFGGASEETALRMITLNAAIQLGVDKYTGSIDVGKDADIAIFNGHPFAPASRVDMTLIDGRVFFDRNTAPTLEWLMQLMRMRPRITSDAGGTR